MLLRYGAKLTPYLADILDMVERAGDRGGIKLECIAGVLYPGKPTSAARQAVKANITHLNDRLAGSDQRVRAVPPRSGVYRLVSIARSSEAAA
jgi:hypothetical protein